MEQRIPSADGEQSSHARYMFVNYLLHTEQRLLGLGKVAIGASHTQAPQTHQNANSQYPDRQTPEVRILLLELQGPVCLSRLPLLRIPEWRSLRLVLAEAIGWSPSRASAVGGCWTGPNFKKTRLRAACLVCDRTKQRLSRDGEQPAYGRYCAPRPTNGQL